MQKRERNGNDNVEGHGRKDGILNKCSKSNGKNKLTNERDDNSIFIVDSGCFQENVEIPTKKDRNYLRKENLTKTSKVVIYSVALFLNMVSFGFLIPLSIVYVDVIRDLGVARSEASLMISVTRGVMFGSGFISSWVYHKLGPVKCVAFGGVVFSVGLLVSSFANHIMLAALPLGILAGVGGSWMNIAGLSTVASSFGRHKSLALSQVTLGSGIAGIVFPQIFEFLLQIYGWRGTIMIYGALILNTLPAAYLLKLNLYKESGQANKQCGNKYDFGVFKFVEFRVYIVGFFIFGIFGLVANFFTVDMIEGKGFGREDGANFISALGVSSFIGRLLFGQLRQFLGFSAVTALPFNSLFLAGVLTTFALFDNYWLLLASCTACGLAYGLQYVTMDLVPHEIVGSEYYSTGYGVSTTICGIGTTICGPIGGKYCAIKDFNGRYDIFYYAAAVGVLVKGVLDTVNVYLKRKHSKQTWNINEK